MGSRNPSHHKSNILLPQTLGVTSFLNEEKFHFKIMGRYEKRPKEKPMFVPIKIMQDISTDTDNYFS
jgi:hypothetical protein